MTDFKYLVIAFLCFCGVQTELFSGNAFLDLGNKKLWQNNSIPALNHDFKTLAKIEKDGLHYQISPRDNRLWIKNITPEIQKNTHLEIFTHGNHWYFSIFCYGKNESGFDASRRLNGGYAPANNCYYPQRTVMPLKNMQRWRQEGVDSMCLSFGGSQRGSHGVVHYIVFRRGADTLQNGAMVMLDEKGQPEFWRFSQPVKMVERKDFPLPVCRMGAGTAATGLDSLKPGKKYSISVWAENKSPEIAVVIRDRSGKDLVKEKLIAGQEKIGNFKLYSTVHSVPENAFSGELQIKFSVPGSFADALLEDLGGASSWHANWVWAPETKNDQRCYLRKEFMIDDPAEITEAFLQATCDDAITLEVNNNRIFNYNVWSSPQFGEVKKYLLKGKNVITGVGYNDGSSAGYIAELRLTKKDGSVSYICTDESWLCQTTDPGANWRRVDPPAETRKNWQPVKVLGRPPVAPWGVNVRYQENMPTGVKEQTPDKEFFASQKTFASINNDLSYPRISINGEIADPVLMGLRGRGDMTGSLHTARTSGFKFFRLGWELSFEAWRSDGSVDFRDLERKMSELLSSVPDAKVILVMRLSPPGWWIKQNEKELLLFADGKYTGADGIFASPASEKWRQETVTMLENVIRHIEQSWYGSAVVGYMPCNLRGPEWVVPNRYRCYPDYSEPMQKYFRKYLREKYDNDLGKLRSAWKNDQITFEKATVPEQKLRMLAQGYFLDPLRQDVMDYNRAASRANVDSIAAVMDAVKRGAPDKLRVLYFGYLMTLAHIGTNPSVAAHNDLSRLLDMKKVDVFCSPISYVWRRPGDISGVGSVESTFRQNKVVWMQEADNRTFLTYKDEHAVTHNPAASLRENWREFIYAMVKRQPIWFYELGGGWYDNECFYRDFQLMRSIYSQAKNEEITCKPPLAMFFDEKFSDGVTLNNFTTTQAMPYALAAEAQRMAALCGVPYDIYELDDIYNLDLSSYKVLYFPNVWRKNPRLAEFLHQKVYPAGKMAVFVYAAGFGQGGGAAGMKELTGMEFEIIPPDTAALYFKSSDGRWIGYPGMRLAENFAVKGAVDIIGTFPDGKIAAAEKNIQKGKSVWLAVHDAEGKILRDLLKSMQVQTLVDYADRVVFDGKYFGLIAVDRPGVRTVTLPGGKLSQITDLYTNRKIPVNGNTFQIYAAPGDAMLFKVEFKR